MERVFQVLETPIDKPDRETAMEAPSIVGEIAFENVCFSYEDSADGDGSDDRKKTAATLTWVRQALTPPAKWIHRRDT